MDNINDFKKQNEHSNSNEVDIMFEVAYKRLFGDSLVRIEKIEYDNSLPRTHPINKLQLNGVDKILHFEDREPIKVDEKLRTKDWGDMLLELESNTTTHTHGWLLNPNSETELIAYLFEETQRVIFVRHDELLAAYHKNAHNWVRNATKFDNGYREIFAKNVREDVVTGKKTKFETYSICVPFKEIKNNVSRWRFYDLKQDITNYKMKQELN